MKLSPVFVAAFLAALVKCGPNKARSFGITTDPKVFAGQSYDYLIVGGGNAGLVLANRLSENPDYTIGVIEAGLYLPDEPLINVPYFFGRSVGNKTLDWAFQTTPQPGMANRTLNQPRGKVLGGSTALTYHNYNRGAAQEYDSWAELGNPGWDWAGIAPYFLKPDDTTPGVAGFLPDVKTRPGIFNRNDGAKKGPIKLSYASHTNFITDTIRLYHDAFKKLGAWSNPDPESGDPTGLTMTARSIDPEKGIRSYATNGYLEPVLHRKNLFVLTGAEATKVLFSNADSKEADLVANGIEYSTKGKIYKASASREVILSAGALKSPQLLELSGIGNKTLLESFGIKTIIDMPEVGENLQDHLEFNQEFILKKDQPYETWDVFRNDPARDAAAWEQYQKNRTGIYQASPPSLDFFPLQAFPDAFDVDEIVSTLDKELASANLTPIRKKQFEIQRRQLIEGKVTQVEIALAPRGQIAPVNEVPILPGRSYFTLVTFLLRPYSTGNVHIGSADPFAAPIIDPRYNEFTFDWKVAALWTRFVRRLMKTEPLASLVERATLPDDSAQSVEDWDNFCRTHGISVWHPVGTTSMAPREIGGVVNHKMVVYGTKNLRVVDAGSMPINVAAHTAATVYAMAEKASDIIKADRRNTWDQPARHA